MSGSDLKRVGMPEKGTGNEICSQKSHLEFTNNWSDLRTEVL